MSSLIYVSTVRNHRFEADVLECQATILCSYIIYLTANYRKYCSLYNRFRNIEVIITKYYQQVNMICHTN